MMKAFQLSLPPHSMNLIMMKKKMLMFNYFIKCFNNLLIKIKMLAVCKLTRVIVCYF